MISVTRSPGHELGRWLSGSRPAPQGWGPEVEPWLPVKARHSVVHAHDHQCWSAGNSGGLWDSWDSPVSAHLPEAGQDCRYVPPNSTSWRFWRAALWGTSLTEPSPSLQIDFFISCAGPLGYIKLCGVYKYGVFVIPNAVHGVFSRYSWLNSSQILCSMFLQKKKQARILGPSLPRRVLA